MKVNLCTTECNVHMCVCVCARCDMSVSVFGWTAESVIQLRNDTWRAEKSKKKKTCEGSKKKKNKQDLN